MRNLLILGGTGWLGREIATQAATAGNVVTCLARGESGPVPDGVRLIVADRTSPDAYAEVAGHHWDEVIEISWDPAFVSAALDALASQSDHWTLVSSVSAYASMSTVDADETAELLPAGDASDYGRAKVACEELTVAAVGADRSLLVRAGLITGPGDETDRWGYWVSRFALAADGPVLVPVQDGRFSQVIDVRDLAGWIVAAGCAGTAGPVDAVGTQTPLADLLAQAADVAKFTGRIVEVCDEDLRAHDVNFWSGPRSLPLWTPPEDAGFMQRSGAQLLASGGNLRSIRETLVDVLADEVARGLDRPRRSGLSRTEELDMLNQLRF